MGRFEGVAREALRRTGLDVPIAGGLFTDPNHDLYKEYAGYLDLTYHLTSQFKVLAGLRVTSDSESNVTPQSGLLFSGVIDGPSGIAIASLSSKTVTYLFSPSYNINDRNMIYIRVASGFRPGGPHRPHY